MGYLGEDTKDLFQSYEGGKLAVHRYHVIVVVNLIAWLYAVSFPEVRSWHNLFDISFISLTAIEYIRSR